MMVKKYKADDERAILTGMIVSDRVLSRIHAHLATERKPFRAKWSNIVAGWCLEFYGRYAKAPGASIRQLFTSFAQTVEDQEVVGIVEKFIASLSNDYKALAKELNEDHLTDVAAKHFNEIRMERLASHISADLIQKDTEKARERIANFNPIKLSTDSFVEVLTDKAATREAFDEQDSEVLIHYSGALGDFFGSHLQRDGFVAMLAPEKRGKSFWLIDMAWRAATRDHRKTLFYSVGDMSQRQMLRRFGTRAAQRPLKAGSYKHPKTVMVTSDGKASVKREDVDIQEKLTAAEAMLCYEKIMRSSGRKESPLRLRCTANGTTSIQDIQTDIDQCVREGWVPDVVVVDYMDILASEPGSGTMDVRHQINETWKAFRRMTQKNHVLGVTATQSDAASYTQEVLRRSNFSEDKRKMAHPTGMFGINQTEEEKGLGVYRLNWIVLREAAFLESQCVTTAGSLDIANPCIVSCW